MIDKARKRMRRKKRVGLAKTAARLAPVSFQQPVEYQRFFRPTINLPPNYVANGYTAPPLPLSRLATERVPLETIKEEPATPIKEEEFTTPVKAERVYSDGEIEEMKTELKKLKPDRGSYPNTAPAILKMIDSIYGGSYKPTKKEMKPKTD
jgi:hypothetical protein